MYNRREQHSQDVHPEHVADGRELIECRRRWRIPQGLVAHRGHEAGGVLWLPGMRMG